MKLGFILLAHNEPAAVKRLVDILAGAGHQVMIHFDASSPEEERQAVIALEHEYPQLVRVISQVPCRWGEWSLVEAVLVVMREFEKMPDKPDYIHLMSAADFPIRPIADMQEFLRRNPDQDYIESYDITKHCWVKAGPSIERFHQYYPVNFRTSRRTFDFLYHLQRKLRIWRKIPLSMAPHMGSQWWTLRWSTCAKVLDFIGKNPHLVKYFRSTWIPDETFFPTVIAHLIPRGEIANIQLLLHHLTPNGRPYIIYLDHIPIIRKLPHFFVRKVAPSAVVALCDMMRTRKDPIPRPKQLARIHDLVCKAIDQSYKFTAILPGNASGLATRHAGKQIVIILTEDDAATALARASASMHPNTIWHGRPFAPEAIELTDETLARTGLDRKMTALRRTFPEQFIDTLVSSFEKGFIHAMVLQKNDRLSVPKLRRRIPGAYIVKTYLPSDATDRQPQHSRYLPAHDIHRFLGDIARPFESSRTKN